MVLRVGARRAGMVLAGLMLLITPAAAQMSAAESLADKFSNDAAVAQRKAEEQRKKDAETKAMEALREQARKRAEEALRAERAKDLKVQAGNARAPAAKPVTEPIDPKVEESEMLSRARQEEADRHRVEQEAEAGRAIERIIAERAAKQREADELARARLVADARRAWQRSAQRISAHEKEIAAAEAARAKIVADARRTWHRSTQRIAAHEKEIAAAEAARAKTVADARRAWRQSTQRIAAHEKEIAAAEAARAKTVADARRTWRQSTQRIAVLERERAAAEAARAELAQDRTVIVVVPPRANPATIPAAAPPSRVQSAAEELPRRVTVLLVMQPGTKGIRRHNKSADPLLCMNEGCYVSSGADAPAHFKPGRQALGLASTWGERAGACRNQLGCVFRGIAVTELPLLVQPVDLRVMKHDRRHMAAVSHDSLCRAEAGRLACARPIIEDDYVMWVIPEHLAESAGPTLLQNAVTGGLVGPQSAAVGSR